MKVTLIQRESTEWKVDMSQPVYFADSSGECITDVICCDYCENWFHYKCKNKKKHIEKTSLKLEARKTHFVTLSVQEVLNSETLILSEIPQTAKRKRTLCFRPQFNYFQKIKQ